MTKKTRSHIVHVIILCAGTTAEGCQKLSDHPPLTPAPRQRWLLPDLYLIITRPWSRVTQHGQESQKHQLVCHYHTANFTNHLITLPHLWLSRCRSWAQPKGRWGFRITVSAHISCCKLASFVTSALFFPRESVISLRSSDMSDQFLSVKKKKPPKCI